MVDMPHVPPQYAQVMLVQASQSQQTKAKYDRTIGVCALWRTPSMVFYRLPTVSRITISLILAISEKTASHFL